LIAADSSVVVAALAAWHPDHAAADAALVRGVRLPAHCAIETYSTLTRMKPPFRAPADVVMRSLRARFRGPWLTLDAGGHRRFLQTAESNAITGGAIYDALVAATAVRHDCALLTLDRRALPVYRLMGADARAPAV